MKKPVPKVIVKPHYIGSEPKGHIFKRVFTNEIQRKIKLKEKAAAEKTT